MLVLKNLHKRRGNRSVLDNVSVSLQKGEIALLLGPSGVGKSTLLRILNGLDVVDDGKMFIDNQAVDFKNPNSSHKIGIVFQNFNLFEHLTAEENIILPLVVCRRKSRKEATGIARLILENFNLSEKAKVYPRQLSGGQKQRLAIARAVAMGPSVLCMDEPTSALDPTSTSQMANQIEQLSSQGFAVIVATHDMTLIDKLNCTIHLMDKGKIVESANSSHFLANKARYPKICRFTQGF